MKIIRPIINGEGFAKAFMLSRAQRKCAIYAEQIGPENLRWLIDNDKSLYDFLKPLLGEHELALKARAKNYAWINEAFSDDDIMSLFPPWVQELLLSYENGQGHRWMQAQITTIRQFFI